MQNRLEISNTFRLNSIAIFINPMTVQLNMANVSLSLATTSWEPMLSQAALENAPENVAS